MKVYHIAYKAVPFVPADQARGLAEIAGKFPAVESGLGIKSGLILPLFKPTLDMIDQLNLRDKMKLAETIPASRFFPESSPVVKIWRMDSPLGYPTYFVENERYSELPKIYGHLNDLEIAFDFADSVLQLLPRLGPAPNALMLHDWQLAALAIKMAQQVKYFGDDQFRGTKMIGFIHDPNYQGRFKRDDFPQARMAWEHHIPPWVEFWKDISMLKGLLYQTDVSLIRSTALINSMKEGHIAEGFHGITQERVDAGKLVAICDNDDQWSPQKELSVHDAEEGVAREITVLRSLLDFPFTGMDHSKPTLPPLKPRVLTMIEIFNNLQPLVSGLYAQLDPRNRSRIEEEVKAGHDDRFSSIRSLGDLKRIVDFLNITPTCDFENEMRTAGLDEFLEYFYPNDINRLLSVELKLAGSKNTGLHPPADGRTTITVYEAMKQLGILEHVLLVFKLMNIIFEAKDTNEVALRNVLDKRGLSSNAADCWTLSLRFRDMSASMMMPFLLGILLHDIGNFIENKNHHAHGRNLLGEAPLQSAILALVSEPELEWIRTLVYYHLIFGTFIIDEDSKYNKILKFWELSPDAEKRKVLIDAMVVLSVVDTRARAVIDSIEHERLKRIHEALIDAKDLNDLEARFKSRGFGEKSKGQSRWDGYVLKSAGARINLTKMKAVEREKEKFWRTRNLNRSAFQKILGSFAIYPLKKLMGRIEDPVHRARFFMFLVDLYREYKFEVASIEISPAETGRFCQMLEKFDIAELRKLAKTGEEGEVVIALDNGGEH